MKAVNNELECRAQRFMLVWRGFLTACLFNTAQAKQVLGQRQRRPLVFIAILSPPPPEYTSLILAL
jgi:hypothetical protein